MGFYSKFDVIYRIFLGFELIFQVNALKLLVFYLNVVVIHLKLALRPLKN